MVLTGSGWGLGSRLTRTSSGAVSGDPERPFGLSRIWAVDYYGRITM